MDGYDGLAGASSSRHLGGAVEDTSIRDGALRWVEEGSPRLEVSREQIDEFGVVGRDDEMRSGAGLLQGGVDARRWRRCGRSCASAAP